MIGEGAPSRGITNLGLEREIRSLSMDKAHRWLRVGVSMDRHKSSRNMQTTRYERLSMVREKRIVRREVSPHVGGGEDGDGAISLSFVMPEKCRNEMGQGLAHRPVIVRVSHDLRGDSWGCVPRSLFWREDLDRDGERGFDYLTFALEKIPFELRRGGLQTQRRGYVIIPQPKNITIIGHKWGIRNKLDENGIVSRNKARLVAQGYNQQEGIDYDETYASVSRLESIRILLAYACALDFKLFQMDVKKCIPEWFYQ
ncbi:copia protein [Tanacetum coccineum]|uniref:Copia protein n=1 Tax=Tanacetum coccineum TaxID=301880 RepID=A0ABQ5G6P4_9ASTR